MSERRAADREPPPRAAPWETAVAMTFLWIIPVAAFVLIMLQGGAHGS